MTEIRQATIGDAESVFKLILEIRHETDYANFLFSPEKAFTSVADWIDKQNSIMFLAIENSEIAGVIAGALFTPWLSNEQCATEEIFFVTKKYRGKGIADALLQSFLNWTKDKCNHVLAGVTTGCGAAADYLYVKHGMKCMGGNYIKHY